MVDVGAALNASVSVGSGFDTPGIAIVMFTRISAPFSLLERRSLGRQ
jgi:hypothetical protein